MNVIQQFFNQNASLIPYVSPLRSLSSFNRKKKNLECSAISAIYLSSYFFTSMRIISGRLLLLWTKITYRISKRFVHLKNIYKN